MTVPRLLLVLVALLPPAGAIAGSDSPREELFGAWCGGDPRPGGAAVQARIAEIEQEQSPVSIGFAAAAALARGVDRQLQGKIVAAYDEAKYATGADRRAVFERAVLTTLLSGLPPSCVPLAERDNAQVVEALGDALLAERGAPIGDAPEVQIGALLRAWVLYATVLHARGRLAVGPAFEEIPWAAADRAAVAKVWARARRGASEGDRLYRSASAASDWRRANTADMRTHVALRGAVAARLQVLWRAIGEEAAVASDWSYALDLHDGSHWGNAPGGVAERASALLAREARVVDDAAVMRARLHVLRVARLDAVDSVQRAVSFDDLLRGHAALRPLDGDEVVTRRFVRESLDGWTRRARAAGLVRTDAVLGWVLQGIDGAGACLGPESRLQHDRPWSCDIVGAPPTVAFVWSARDRTDADEVHRTYTERGVVGERDVPRPTPRSRSGLSYYQAKARIGELRREKRFLEGQAQGLESFGFGLNETERVRYLKDLRLREAAVNGEGLQLEDQVRAWEFWLANPTMKEPVYGDVVREERQNYARFTADVTARVTYGGASGPELRLSVPVRARAFIGRWGDGVDRIVFAETVRRLDLATVTLGLVRQATASAPAPTDEAERAAMAFLAAPAADRLLALLRAIDAVPDGASSAAVAADNEARIARAQAEADALAARYGSDEAKAALEATVREAAAQAEAERVEAARVEAERLVRAEAAAAAQAEAERVEAERLARAEAEIEAAVAARRAADEARAEADRLAAEARRRPVEIRGVVRSGGAPARGSVMVYACGASAALDQQGRFTLTAQVDPQSRTCEAHAARFEGALLVGPSVAITVEGDRLEVDLEVPRAAGRVGVAVEATDGGVRVAQLAPGGPAARAGLRVGDRIVAVDGASTDGWSSGGFAMKVIGAPGTTVRLDVQPARGKPREVTLTREEVAVAAE